MISPPDGPRPILATQGSASRRPGRDAHQQEEAMRMLGTALIGTVAGAALTLLASTGWAEPKFAGIDVAPAKVGTIADMKDIKEFCGTKPIKAGLSAGYGENSWRKITHAEFEDEASNCPNTQEVPYP